MADRCSIKVGCYDVVHMIASNHSPGPVWLQCRLHAQTCYHAFTVPDRYHVGISMVTRLATASNTSMVTMLKSSQLETVYFWPPVW